MEKVYIVYDYEDEIVGVISDKFYKNKLELENAIYELLSEFGRDRYWTYVHVEEYTLYDTVSQAVKMTKE